MGEAVTEAEWLADVEPTEHLHWFDGEDTSYRKLRLFGAACCRVVWHLLRDESRQAVVDVERCVDEPEHWLALVDVHATFEAHCLRQGRVTFATQTAQDAVRALVGTEVWRAAFTGASKIASRPNFFIRYRLSSSDSLFSVMTQYLHPSATARAISIVS